MKKVLLAISISIALSLNLYSQSFNVGISGGYGFPLAPDYHLNSSTQYANPNVPNTSSLVLGSVTPVSYGNGGNVAVGIDWYSKVNIGLGLKLNAFFSAPVEYSATYNDLNYHTTNYDYTDKGYSFQFIPHINLKHDFKKFSPYVEMGVIIGINHINENDNAIDYAGNIYNQSLNFYGNVFLGFYSSLGLAVKLSKLLRFTAVVNCTAGSYSPTQYKITGFTINGANQLNGVSATALQGTFVKQANFTAQGENLRSSYPFSNIGINVGICLVFPTKAAAAKTKSTSGFHAF